MKVIARIKCDYKEKFGIPRQSGLVMGVVGRIVFEPEYRRDEALVGIEGFSHLWLIWGFSKAERDTWSPTVRPPRLGGNKRMGVFATRSPFRPNPIGLSSVKLVGVEKTKDEGTVLLVEGVDLLDGTPIYDVKPYLAYTDSHPEAIGGFADGVKDYKVEVRFDVGVIDKVDENERATLISILEGDPCPSYKSEPDYEYGMSFSRYEIHFKKDDTGITVTRVEAK